ncbi:MAG: hypothetical protein ACI4UE_03925 [Candidatus Scatovivens sp.]
MKKKIAIIITILILILLTFSNTYALEEKSEGTSSPTELVNIKESTNDKLAEYADKYGSTTYGLVAYILNALRIYSIPFCFVGIAVGSIYQYVIGIRRLDTRDKGFALIITFVTILLICQVLPLIFAIVVNGWRG